MFNWYSQESNFLHGCYPNPDNLPLCMDWHNYSGKWLARHLLGLPKILTRLLAAEEVTSIDPDLIKMSEIALATRAQIKAILGFTISPKCTPIWLLSTLLDQLGLKMVSRRKGGQGQQMTTKNEPVEKEEIEFNYSLPKTSRGDKIARK